MTNGNSDKALQWWELTCNSEKRRELSKEYFPDRNVLTVRDIEMIYNSEKQ